MGPPVPGLFPVEYDNFLIKLIEEQGRAQNFFRGRFSFLGFYLFRDFSNVMSIIFIKYRDIDKIDLSINFLLDFL